MTDAKLWLGGAGVLLAAAAVALGSSPLGWVAAAVLAGAVVMRIRARRASESDESGTGLPRDG